MADHYCSLGKHFVPLSEVSSSSKHRSGDACLECARKRTREKAAAKIRESKKNKREKLFDHNNYKKMFI